MTLHFFGVIPAAILAMLAGTAQAAVVISACATKNMTCTNGVCEPTAVDAVLNTGDLETLLATGDVEVATTGSGVEAKDIEVSDAFGWTTQSGLTLHAHRSIVVDAAVTVEGQGALAIRDHGGLSFSRKGHVSFANVSSSLLINGRALTLEDSIKSLAKAVARNPDGQYALANDYDASKDGTYDTAPVRELHTDGTFDGLGNTISNLKIVDRRAGYHDVGLFGANFRAFIGDITLRNVSIKATGDGEIGALVGDNAEGGLVGAHATGSVTGGRNASVGGLVGGNSGSMYNDDANVVVVTGPGGGSSGGGLVGANGGEMAECYAEGSANGLEVGGLVGFNLGNIDNSYARGSANGHYSGGLIGYNQVINSAGAAESSYSTGKVRGTRYAGGLIGLDNTRGEYLENTYWDTTTSKITRRSQGAGSPKNDPGITGLTTAQFQSGLPAGFDPAVWAESATVNDGLPYLISDPPQ